MSQDNNGDGDEDGKYFIVKEESGFGDDGVESRNVSCLVPIQLEGELDGYENIEWTRVDRNSIMIHTPLPATNNIEYSDNMRVFLATVQNLRRRSTMVSEIEEDDEEDDVSDEEEPNTSLRVGKVPQLKEFPIVALPKPPIPRTTEFYKHCKSRQDAIRAKKEKRRTDESSSSAPEFEYVEPDPTSEPGPSMVRIRVERSGDNQANEEGSQEEGEKGTKSAETTPSEKPKMPYRYNTRSQKGKFQQVEDPPIVILPKGPKVKGEEYYILSNRRREERRRKKERNAEIKRKKENTRFENWINSLNGYRRTVDRDRSNHEPSLFDSTIGQPVDIQLEVHDPEHPPDIVLVDTMEVGAYCVVGDDSVSNAPPGPRQPPVGRLEVRNLSNNYVMEEGVRLRSQRRSGQSDTSNRSTGNLDVVRPERQRRSGRSNVSNLSTENLEAEGVVSNGAQGNDQQVEVVDVVDVASLELILVQDTVVESTGTSVSNVSNLETRQPVVEGLPDASIMSTETQENGQVVAGGQHKDHVDSQESESVKVEPVDDEEPTGVVEDMAVAIDSTGSSVSNIEPLHQVVESERCLGRSDAPILNIENPEAVGNASNGVGPIDPQVGVVEKEGQQAHEVDLERVKVEPVEAEQSSGVVDNMDVAVGSTGSPSSVPNIEPVQRVVESQINSDQSDASKDVQGRDSQVGIVGEAGQQTDQVDLERVKVELVEAEESSGVVDKMASAVDSTGSSVSNQETRQPVVEWERRTIRSDASSLPTKKPEAQGDASKSVQEKEPKVEAVEGGDQQADLGRVKIEPVEADQLSGLVNNTDTALGSTGSSNSNRGTFRKIKVENDPDEAGNGSDASPTKRPRTDPQ